jgi:hypothetical protein
MEVGSRGIYNFFGRLSYRGRWGRRAQTSGEVQEVGIEGNQRERELEEDFGK